MIIGIVILYANVDKIATDDNFSLSRLPWTVGFHSFRPASVSDECVDALRGHWGDRDQDFDAADAGGPLVAPLVIPPTP
ncbi:MULTISPECIES: hypothetical protein [unclassified Burkholderia]|uniref:hypothetical protein n=1 Tax=unclassified Burkholderia TaxID=2613784 RepID=UPI0026D86066|nr:MULTISPECIES: hypothetical protein [unclassified Burkholderia]